MKGGNCFGKDLLNIPFLFGYGIPANSPKSCTSEHSSVAPVSRVKASAFSAAAEEHGVGVCMMCFGVMPSEL